MMGTPVLKIFFAFAAIYVIWGSTYAVLRIGIETIPPFLLSSTRFFLAGTLLLGWCLSKKQALPNGRSVLINSIYGICMLGGGTVSVAWSEQFIPSSTAAIIVAFEPFWFVLLDKKQWHYYFSNKIILVGLLLGFAGVVLLVGLTHPDTTNLNRPGHSTLGMLAILCGGIAWTMGSLYSKYKPTNSGLLMNSSIQMFATSIVCFAVSIVAGEWKSFSWMQVSANSFIAMLYLATAGSIIAYSSYLYLLRVRPPAQVSSYMYVNPLIAVLFGAVLTNERISSIQLVALFIILCGVVLVNVPKYRTFLYAKSK